MKSVTFALLALMITVVLSAEAKASMTKSMAKKQCLQNDPTLSGKKLQKCIKGQRKK